MLYLPFKILQMVVGGVMSRPWQDLNHLRTTLLCFLLPALVETEGHYIANIHVVPFILLRSLWLAISSLSAVNYYIQKVQNPT